MKRIQLSIITFILCICCIILGYVTQIRTCIFYNIFHIPCIGCGLSRATIELVQGNILEAIRYNCLIILLVPGFIGVVVWNIIDKIKNQNTFYNFIEKYKKIIIIITTCIVIVVWILNLNNNLLY